LASRWRVRSNLLVNGVIDRQLNRPMKHSEDYYKKYDRLYKAERAAFRKAEREGGKFWHKWQIAAKRLLDHENSF